jgi:Tfp pilus assembly protein PilO
MNKLFVIIGLIVGTVLIGWFLTYPAFLEYNKSNEEIEVKKQLFSDRENYLAKLNEASLTLQEYKDKLEKIDSALPEEVSLPELYDYFLRVVSGAGLAYKDLNISGANSIQDNVQFEETIIPSDDSVFINKNIREVKETKITLSVSGSYDQFKELLKKIQSSSRLFKIQEMEIGIEGSDSLGSGIEGGPLVSVQKNQNFLFVLELTTSSY